MNSISFKNSRIGNDLTETKCLPSFGNLHAAAANAHSPLMPTVAPNVNNNVTPLIKNKNLTGIFTGSQNIMNQTWGAIDVNNFAITPAIKTQNQAQASEETSSRDTRLKMQPKLLGKPPYLRK